MKKKYLYCIFLVLLAFHVESQPLLKSRKLHGLNPVVLGEGNVNAISYAEGIIFFATQLGVELYYNNQIIATFTYLELTGKASNSRYEQVELYADVDRHCMFVKDNKGSGKIKRTSGAFY